MFYVCKNLPFLGWASTLFIVMGLKWCLIAGAPEECCEMCNLANHFFGFAYSEAGVSNVSGQAAADHADGLEGAETAAAQRAAAGDVRVQHGGGVG